MRGRLKHTVSMIALASLLMSQHSAYSAAGNGRLEPVVRGQVIRDFARITFEWPKEVYVTSSVQGNVLTIRFDHSAEPDFGGILSNLSPYITKAQLEGDGKTVKFTLDKPHRVRSFISGNVSGVDVLDIEAPPVVASVPSPAVTAPMVEKSGKEKTAKDDEIVETQGVQETPPPRAPSLPSRSRSVSAAPIQSVSSYALLEPNAGAEPEAPAVSAAPPTPATKEAPKEKPPEKTAEITPEKTSEKTSEKPAEKLAQKPAQKQVQKSLAASLPEKAVEQASEKLPEKSPEKPAESLAEKLAPLPPKHVEAVAAAEKVPAEKAAAAPPKPVTEHSLSQAEPKIHKPHTSEEVANAASDKTTLRPFASNADGRQTLRFPWSERVALASFTRGASLWIVFNRAVKMDLEAVRQLTPDLYSNMQSYTSGNATVIRIAVPESSGALVSKDDDSFEWRVSITKTSQPPGNALRVDTNTEPPLLPHIFLPALEMAEAVTLKDPEVGDELIVIPSYKAVDGVAPARRYVDFALLESATGIAVQKFADDVTLSPQRNGLRISTEDGANLTPGLPSLTQSREEKSDSPQHSAAKPGMYASAEGTLFPYNDWRASVDEPFVKQVQVLLRAISLSKSSEDAMRLRVRLAQLYISEGMSTETLAVLGQIRRIDPQFYAQQRLSALSGAANFLLYRFADAQEDFAQQELQNLPETAYWNNMLLDLLGKPNQAFDYLGNYENFIRKYPPLMKQRLAITAADRAIGSTDYNTGLQILDTLKESDIAGAGESYVTYLAAKIAVETGKTAEGMASWQELAEDYTHDFVRVRAEFSLIGQRLKQKDVAIDDVLDQLERLRLSWRGDALEMNVLTFVGDIYEQKSDYINAMKTWRNIVTSYPGTVAAADAENKMKSAFVELFDRGMISVLPLLDQVALYYDFRDLTPADASGDRIVMGLVDRLMALDLLDQAATIVDQRMRFTYEQETRSRAGTKLAQIQIMNRQWQKALDALQSSVYGNNPEDLRTERDRLAATAMAELGRVDESMRLLTTDKSEEASDIRLRAWWKQKDWPKVIEGIEASLKTRRDTTKPLTARETERVIELAMAYLTENDAQQLQYLRDYFTPLMKDSPRLALFDFITRPDVPTTPQAFAELMKQVDDTKSFMQNYNIRNRGKELFPAELAATFPTTMNKEPPAVTLPKTPTEASSETSKAEPEKKPAPAE